MKPPSYGSEFGQGGPAVQDSGGPGGRRQQKQPVSATAWISSSEVK